MKGDFSRWTREDEQNLQGVLHQQGRVLLDSDWNDQTQLALDWQEGAAQDVIGAGVVAVPARTPNALKVVEARVAGDEIELDVHPGKVWANGLAVELPPDPADATAPISRLATYLKPPIQDPPGEVADIDAGVRDAVILEVKRSALNGFQRPDLLIEPALGGPDTTERVQYSLRFRLYRMEEGDTCNNLSQRLQDDFSQKGKLKATLLPATSTGGDCPVEEGGGYVGFEHHLYRVEIARVDAAQPTFKWSQFNGGLVGRGRCELAGPDKKVVITANDQAIKTSGLHSFYMEVVEYDEDQGVWRVTYGADVTLDGDELIVGTERYTEPSVPSGRAFFRLWNGVEEISSYPIVPAGADPTELRDGIRLEFEADSGDNYQPGDFWTFEVRAGDLANPDPLIDDEAPHGVHHQRVPLAVLNWDADQEISFEADQIEDCRDPFRPLTQQKVCCSFTVGDGVSTFGDFNSIEQALRHLPASGGEICLLPGTHYANVVIEGRKDITIRGCDKRAVVLPQESTPADPIFQVVDSTGIVFEHLDLVTLFGSAILLQGSELGDLSSVAIRHNRIAAFKHAVHAFQVWDVHIHHNSIRMWDREEGDVAIFFHGEDGTIERNEIAVVPAGTEPPPEDVPEDEVPDPSDDCLEPEEAYQAVGVVLLLAWAFFEMGLVQFQPVDPYLALGGIQVGSGSERLRILENRIQGGAGNGITLGSDLDPEDLAGIGEAAEEAEPIEVDVEDEAIWGEVNTEEGPLANMGVIFQDEDGVPRSDITDTDGSFSLRGLAPGSHQVSLADPNYQIVSIEFQDRGEFGPYYIIEAERIEPEVDLGGLMDFIYQVAVVDNNINGMALSGIGVPKVTMQDLTDFEGPVEALRMAPQLLIAFLLVRLFGFLGGFVVDLRIDGNRIHNCLQRVPDPEADSILRGEGGISLGLCEGLRIRDNRIEANGTTVNNPITGVFVIYADQLELSRNHILGNGPVVEEGVEVASGLWGGIVVVFASGFSLAAKLLGDEKNPVEGEFAARISDNVIDQPLSRALTMLGFGPMSVMDNRFNVVSSASDGIDLFVGAVLIANLGGFNRLTDPQIRGKVTMQTRAPQREESVAEEEAGIEEEDVESGNGDANFFAEAPAMVELQPTTELGRVEAPQEFLPDGNTLYNGNQTRLGRRSRSAVAQLILTADDLGYDGNQSDMMPTLESLALAALGTNAPDRRLFSMINTVLFGATVRANDSRFKESMVEQYGLRALSLLSLSYTMNNTTNDQGNHCIIAASLLAGSYPGHNMLVSEGNQSLLYPIEICKGFETTIATRPKSLIFVLAALFLGRS